MTIPGERQGPNRFGGGHSQWNVEWLLSGGKPNFAHSQVSIKCHSEFLCCPHDYFMDLKVLHTQLGPQSTLETTHCTMEGLDVNYDKAGVQELLTKNVNISTYTSIKSY